MQKKVVVIGGAGFIGSHVADELSERGYKVKVFDIRKSKWIRPDQSEVIGDILSESDLRDAIRGSSAVYHFAGIADIGESSQNPFLTIESNVMGAVKCAQVCVDEGVKHFLYASTMYVYSNRGSFYRASKQAAEVLIESYCDKYDLNYTFLRYGSLYGPRSQEWNGLRKYVTQAVRDRKITYIGTGSERREYIHVHDAARLSVDALCKSYVNSSLILTGTQVLTSAELFKMIEEILGYDLKIEFTGESSCDHYSSTAYRYVPKIAKKLISNEFVDIGQGVLNLIAEVDLSSDQG